MAIRRKNNKSGFSYEVCFRDSYGKWRSKSFSKRAEIFERYVKDGKERDEFPDLFKEKKRILFSDLAKKWLELHSKPHKAPSSLSGIKE